MNQKIQSALAKLDPSNDNHWTQDGLPRLDTIRILVSDPTLTRSQVTLAAPEFNRSRAETPASAAPAVLAVTATAVQPDAALTRADELVSAMPKLASSPMADKSIESDRRRAAELQLQLSDALKRASDVQEEINQIQNEIGELHEQTAFAAGESLGSTIQKYLNQQRENLLAKAAQQKMLLESGLDLKAIADGFRDPIDVSKKKK